MEDQPILLKVGSGLKNVVNVVSHTLSLGLDLVLPTMARNHFFLKILFLNHQRKKDKDGKTKLEEDSS